MADTRDLLTLRQAAEELGVSLNTVYRLTRNRDLEVVEFPGSRIKRVRRSAIDAFLARQTRGAAPMRPTRARRKSA